MPLLETKGAASAQGFGLTIGAADITYVENVFSCFLYTGTGVTQTITNDIDLSTKGGLVWIKSRSAATGHRLTDTVRGATKSLASETTAAQATESTGLTAFATTGFTIGADTDYNTSAATYVSWAFQERAKFFDVVTYTGTGVNATIAHNLGSVPGCMIVKRTDTAEDWAVYHTSLANTEYLVLNTTAAKATGATWWNSTTPTSSVFSVGTSTSVNASAGTYVAYLFAHNAGGFGLTGTDNVISCGSFTTDGAGDATVTLGYEPQFGLGKASSTTSTWIITDIMRGMTAAGGTNAQLFPNTSAAEASGTGYFHPTATGFTFSGGGATVTWIYVAIRRGPMKVPTLGTTVYNAIARTGTGATATMTGLGFPPDLFVMKIRDTNDTTGAWWSDRLRGLSYISSFSTNAEVTDSGGVGYDVDEYTMDGVKVGAPSSTQINTNTITQMNWFFKRAPSFFDEVCYSGSGSTSAVSHNLTVQPELIIYKSRSNVTNWIVHTPALIAANQFLRLDLTDAVAANSTQGYTNSGTPTTTTITPGTSLLNMSSWTYVAYLFATCPGVSKVGGYTGNGSTQTINCGFTAGARFVLIKRTDATGNWYVYDTTRGMTTLTDPYLWLNTTDVEIATLGSVTTVSTGFALNSAIVAAINVNTGSYIFLAIS